MVDQSGFVRKIDGGFLLLDMALSLIPSLVVVLVFYL